MADSVLTNNYNSATDKAGTNYMFYGTLDPNYAFTKFTLMRGVTDFTNLVQFDLYETGYSFLICLSIPKFLEEMKKVGTEYQYLIDSYRHILEYEFRGAQGIEDITSETNSITNGIDELNVITRVREQSASTFSMNYYERSGSVLTKVNEMYLRGIKDPRTQFKRYNGLIHKRNNRLDNVQAPGSIGTSAIQGKGYHYEVFHFLLIVTDNTGLNLEKAYILASCQPTQANTSIYNVTRGEIGFSELSLQFNGFPISGRIVNYKATKFLDWINDNTCFDEMSFGYNIFNNSAMEDENIAQREIMASPMYDNSNMSKNAIKNPPSSNVKYTSMMTDSVSPFEEKISSTV